MEDIYEIPRTEEKYIFIFIKWQAKWPKNDKICQGTMQEKDGFIVSYFHFS